MRRPTLVFVFLLGVIAGALLPRLLPQRRGMPDPAHVVKHLTRALKLDDPQQAQVKALVEENAPKMRQLHVEAHDKLDAMRRELDGKIEALLKPEQKAKFAQMRARWEKRREERRQQRL